MNVRAEHGASDHMVRQYINELVLVGEELVDGVLPECGKSLVGGRKDGEGAIA